MGSTSTVGSCCEATDPDDHSSGTDRSPLSADIRRVLTAQALRAFAYGLGAVLSLAERTAAAATTNSARYLTRPICTALGGVVASAAIGAPFLIAGSIKSAYDLVLWRWFRTVRVPDETSR